ncbi:hypothetical protein CIB95_13430 [Lottiidibacillus patelloidae]|uniref:Aminoglycoside phosphotransferase domain-containing protein n=1 Tax=Lottiidibacillus patelloidae TaxID=2670334 RepID=A0A263BQX6_9BACI|nr:aminoglycoside phosphotransferase family protein [Lottiidibacillus patelloidae]OZM56105.1 hypothetical protein CIB95_13430 [Lottiidibacillus patelloidae]
MKIEHICETLRKENVIQSKNIHFKKLNGGSSSEVYLVDNTYVVKLNKKEVIEEEVNFLQKYQGVKMLPKLIYTNLAEAYLVYEFKKGDTCYPRKNKQLLLEDLVNNFINKYEMVSSNQTWGWSSSPTDSWHRFLLDRVIDAKEMLKDKLLDNDFSIILTLINKKEKENNDAYYIHGDCGVHNFIFHNNKLSAVIDPTPVYGEPIYDLIYAFCSSPDDLTKETIEAASSHLIKGNKSGRDLYEDVTIGLFLRLATCLRHHPADFEDYMKSWKYWREIVAK